MSEDPVLLVCHSQGDTETLLDTARALKKQSKPYQFLAVGHVAKRKLKEEEAYIEIDDSFKDSQKLSEQQRSELIDSLNAKLKNGDGELIFGRAIVGTPSQQTDVPMQIADWCMEELGNNKNKVAISNEYLFFDEKHVFWDQIRDKRHTRDNYHVLVPTNYTRDQVKSFNDKVDVSVVGHIAFDRQQSVDKDTIKQHRKDLNIEDDNIKDGNHFVFFAGGKNSEEDKETLTSLLEALRDKPEIKEQTQIRIGMHPAVKNKKNYLEELSSVIQEGDPVQFIITPKFKAELEKELESNQDVDEWLKDELRLPYVEVDISGSQCNEAANAVVSANPATDASTAAIAGKPVFTYKEGSYLPRNMTTDPNDFWDQMAADNKDAIKREEVGAEDRPVGDNIVSAVYSKKV